MATPLGNRRRRDMKTLANRIRRELEADDSKWLRSAAVNEDELQRIWPLNDGNRGGKIEQFAKEHGFRLSFYEKGRGAIFVMSDVLTAALAKLGVLIEGGLLKT